jgi:hypothetical protein
VRGDGGWTSKAAPRGIRRADADIAGAAEISLPIQDVPSAHFHHLPVSFSSPNLPNLLHCTAGAGAHACSLSVLKGTRWM